MTRLKFDCLSVTLSFLNSLKSLEKLKRQLAEADAALEARKKPPEEAGPKIIGEGLVIDEWVSLSLFVFQSKSFQNSELSLIIYTSILCLYRKNGGKDTWRNSKLKG